jgi:hypothetical protein
MRVASWHDGGEPSQRASQCSPLVTASSGPAEMRLTLTRHFRLGFEPIVEIAAFRFAAEFEEFVGPFPNLLVKLFSRLCQFLLFALSVLPLFHTVVPAFPAKRSSLIRQCLPRLVNLAKMNS